ncbi:hypothetical protein MHYP_G00192920 [Metynnis hypsauchen]
MSGIQSVQLFLPPRQTEPRRVSAAGGGGPAETERQTRKSVFRRLKIFQKKPKKDDDGNSGAQNKSKRSIFTRMFCWK